MTGIPQSARASGVATTLVYEDLRQAGTAFLPMRVALVGQGSDLVNYDTVPVQVFSAFEVGETYGFGSPLHLAALKLLPVNGDGIGAIPLTVYPLEADGSGVEGTALITITGATASADANIIVRVNNEPTAELAIPFGTTLAEITTLISDAINAVLNMPVIADDGTPTAGIVTNTAKWSGASGDALFIEIETDVDSGFTFVISQGAAENTGANDPDVQDALDNISDQVWETMLLNCLLTSNTTALGVYNAWGEGRYEPEVQKPAIVFTGATPISVATAIAIPDARPTDRINGQLVSVGGVDLPWVVGARELARIAVIANNNPAKSYQRQIADGLTPGADADQWTYAQRDAALAGGSSTSLVIDGVVTIQDVVTFFHPTGQINPGYQYVVSIVKLMQILYNMQLIFDNSAWAGAPLLPDNTVTVNVDAVQPKTAVTAIAQMVDNLALNAILSDPTTAKATIVASISNSNPNRLDTTFTAQLSGNANIIDNVVKFGFFFG